MSNSMFTKITQGVIWSCLGVILFSPLFINSHLFFPYVVTKTLAFNIAVEIALVAFLFLSFKNKDYKIKINLVVVLMAVYLGITIISSLLGNNFYRSFWSNNERSEGILLLLHLFTFLIILSSFLKKFKDWLLAFDLYFLASFLVSITALLQYFKIDWWYFWTDQRLSGTIGNAGYMAGYLIFAILLGLFLFFKRDNRYLRIYYIAVVLFEIFIVLNTFTRGGMIALFLTLLTFIIYLAFFYFDNKKSRNIGRWVIVLLILFTIIGISNRNSDLFNQNKIFQRVTSISINDETTQNRLMTWSSSFEGFKERPVLGWGYENFYQPFDRHFNPQIYRDSGSVVWFDRAHNIIFDRLITGGIVGLISYLALLLVPIYYLWKLKSDKENNDKKYFIPLVFTLIMVAYFIQNLFIFEALVTYIPLFLVLAFIGSFGRDYNWKFITQPRVQKFLFVIAIILLIPVLYFVNIKPLRANIMLVKVMGSNDITIEDRLDNFNQLLSRDTYGNQEYRRHYFNFLNNLMKVQVLDKSEAKKILNRAEREFEKQLEEDPNNAMNYILMMKFNNLSHPYNLDRLGNNFPLFDRVKILAPNRPSIYYEMGYTYFNLANYFNVVGDNQRFEEHIDLAVEVLEKAVALNDTNSDSYRHLANILLSAGRQDEAVKVAQKVIDMNLSYTNWTGVLIK